MNDVSLRKVTEPDETQQRVRSGESNKTTTTNYKHISLLRIVCQLLNNVTESLIDADSGCM